MSAGGFTARDKYYSGRTAWEQAEFTPARTALIVVSPHVKRDAGLLSDLADRGHDCTYLSDRLNTTVVPNTSSLIEAFAGAGSAVAHVRAGGIPKGHDRADAHDFSAGHEYDLVTQVDQGHLIVTKLGIGGFTIPDLDQHLRSKGISTVFYAGVLSDLGVLQSVAAGMELGYAGYMVADATGTLSEERQYACEETAASMAECVSAKEAIALLLARAPAVRKGR
jgi:nicotinamidase-related amidase